LGLYRKLSRSGLDVELIVFDKNSMVPPAWASVLREILRNWRKMAKIVNLSPRQV